MEPKSRSEELRLLPGMLDAKKVAPFIDINLKVLYRKCKAGAVPHLRYLGKIKFDPLQLADWLDEHDAGCGKGGRR
jgi:hypothetical protein